MNKHENKYYQFFKEKYDKGKRVSFNEAEIFFNQKALEFDSEYNPWKKYSSYLKNEFNTYRSNEIPILNKEILEKQTSLQKDQQQLDDLQKNKDHHIKQRRKAHKTKHAQKATEHKVEIKKLERKIKQKTTEIFKLKLYLSSKTDRVPPVKISKFLLIFISVIYALVASVLNVPVFTQAINGIPIAGIILAPLMGIVEVSAAHKIGQAFARDDKKRGKILIGASALLLAIIISAQLYYTEHSLLSSSLIVILFVLGAVFSFMHHISDFEREIIQKEDERDELKLKRDKTLASQGDLKEKIDIDPQKEVENEIAQLHTSINSLKKEISTLKATKTERIEQINALEQKISSQAEIIFNLTQNI